MKSMGDPLQRGDDCGPFPRERCCIPILKFSTIASASCSAIVSKLVIETKAIVASQSLLDHWNEGRNVVGLRCLSSTRELMTFSGNPCNCCIICVLQRRTTLCGPDQP